MENLTTGKELALRVIYITLWPEKYPRVEKIATSLQGENVDFQVLAPKIRIKLGSSKFERLISASVNYFCFLMQIFFAKADVYWITTSPDIFVLPLVFKKSRYLLDYRSSWPSEVMLEFGQGLLSRVAGYITYITLRHSMAITLPSSTFLRDVSKLGRRVFIIPNYPLRKDFEPQIPRKQFRKLHGVEDDKKVVLFVGKLSMLEGVDILPSIIEELTQKTREIIFWIVGEGVLRSIAVELEKRFPENVKFFGWRPHREIPNFINAADLCIVPRHETPFFHYYNEENVQKISEYMFFKKPIVACGIAPSKEYLLVTRQDMVRGILEALEGNSPKPTPRTWEDDSEHVVREVINFLKYSASRKCLRDFAHNL